MKKCKYCPNNFYPVSPANIRCPNCSSASKLSAKKYYQKDPRKRASSRYIYKYGLSLERIEKMYKELGGKCPICSSKMMLGGMRGICATIDHDHKTGAIRGLICSHCNRGLGGFRDSFQILLKASQYMKKFEKSLVDKNRKK